MISTALKLLDLYLNFLSSSFLFCIKTKLSFELLYFIELPFKESFKFIFLLKEIISSLFKFEFSFIEEYKTWLPTLLSEHPAALTVHLRTRKEMSKVAAHYELIPEIIKLRKEISPETKLIINGDIKDRISALEMYKKYPELDGFMIGRGVFQNPYCFTNHIPTREE